MVGGDFDALVGREDDPRLTGEYVRELDDGEIVLVGVVHDHPASIHRSSTVVEALDPASVALEIPEGLVPLFQQYATDDTDAGGEMVAAIDGFSGDVVGIDLPSRGTFRGLASRLWNEDISLEAKGRAVATVGRLYAHTVRGRLVAAGVPSQWLGRDPGDTRSYDCSPTDDPASQADHEKVHVQRSKSLSRAFTAPAMTRVLDAAREEAMIRRIEELQKNGPVVAVLGYDHIDAVAAGLTGEAPPP